MMFLAFVFIVGQLTCLFIEGSFFGQEEVDVVNSLTGYNTLQLSGGGFWNIPKLAMGFITTGLPKMIMWDYSFLDGGWAMVKWLMLYPISIGVVWGLTMVFIGVVQGVMSAFFRLF